MEHFRNKCGLHKGEARSDKIARRNDVSTIGVPGTAFATSVQIRTRLGNTVWLLEAPY